MDAQKMNALISQLQTLDIPENDPYRTKVQDALAKAQSRLEGPFDKFITMFRMHVHSAVIRTGIDLGLFKYLAQNPGSSFSVDDLAKQLGAAPILLNRILRVLAAIDATEETRLYQFGASKMTFIFASPLGEAFVRHLFDMHGPTLQVLPSYLSETGYKDITSTKFTPFHKAFNTDMPFFEWLSERPQMLEAFQTTMTTFQSSEWLKDFKTLDEAVSSYLTEEVERPFFVDVGASQGHQTISLQKKYPELAQKSGSLLLQDLAEAIQGVQIEGVDTMVHDFFTEQPVIGAKIYYLRRILHDWPDNSCTEILARLAAAMATDSMIMIDEMVVPEFKAPQFPVTADILLMAGLGGAERSVREWERLAESVGLKVKEIHSYDENRAFGVVVLVK